MNVRLTRTANTRTYSRPCEDERGEKDKRRSAVNLFDLATEALDLLRQDALRKSTAMPSLSGDASPRSPRETSVLAEATKGKGLGLAEEYGTVEELLQRRASGAELEGALESARQGVVQYCPTPF